MSLWTERILSHFTADLTRLWVACDPDDVLLDEKLLTELRSRGFELMLYEDPFAFIRPEGFFGWLQIWTKIIWENGVLRRSSVGRKLMGLTKEVRTLRYLKAQKVVARLDRPEEFELDGDDFGLAVAIKAHVEKQALVVRIPADREIADDENTERAASGESAADADAVTVESA